jgi:hypothetical protein
VLITEKSHKIRRFAWGILTIAIFSLSITTFKSTRDLFVSILLCIGISSGLAPILAKEKPFSRRTNMLLAIVAIAAFIATFVALVA